VIQKKLGYEKSNNNQATTMLSQGDLPNAVRITFIKKGSIDRKLTFLIQWDKPVLHSCNDGGADSVLKIKYSFLLKGEFKTLCAP
jgi:hypothetical protein